MSIRKGIEVNAADLFVEKVLERTSLTLTLSQRESGRFEVEMQSNISQSVEIDNQYAKK
jgi:hypothetical protein